jgi:hypothetical protein
MAHDTSLTRVRLELARTPEFPSGSSWHGFEFIAPLTSDGHVDPTAWNRVKEICLVTRFWGDDLEDHGQFAHVGHGWCFKYPKGGKVDRESVFKLDRHRFTPGGYLTVTEPDGEQHPFRIVAMTPAILAD